MNWRKVCHGEASKTSLGSSSGLTTQAASIREHLLCVSRHPVLSDTPDVTCPSDYPDSEKRKEVVHHNQIPDYDVSKRRSLTNDKKSNVVIKAKRIPVTPKSVASSQGAMRERWLVSIYKEIENFLQNMAIEDVDPSFSGEMEDYGQMATSMSDGFRAEAVDTVITTGQ